MCFTQESENHTVPAGMAEKIHAGYQTGTKNVLKCISLNIGCFGWYQMVSSVTTISNGICVSGQYKKCSSNLVASAFNFFLVTTLFFSSPFHRRQQLLVTVSSSFLSFSFSFYLLLSLFYHTLLFHCLAIPHVSKSKWKYMVYRLKSCGRINEFMWFVNLPGGKY